MSPPQLVFGAGGIGNTAESFTYTWTTPELVSSLLNTLTDLRLSELDSAASYPPFNPWNTETLLGEAKASEKGFVIDSKVAIHTGPTLDSKTIPASIDRTLSLLGATRVRTLYAHAPDPVTPAAITAEAFDREFKLGKFERLGLCNYPVEKLREYFAVCEDKGFVKPAVYQGHYNALVRNHEGELIPLLRQHGCAYYAYSPLAGGFLTGKVTFASSASAPDPASSRPPPASLHRTRWAGASEFAYYTRMFDRPHVHAAVRQLQAALDAYNANSSRQISAALTLTEASLRWLMHHSALTAEKGDGVILGAKSEEQLRGNVALARAGPLPPEIVAAVETMWKDVAGTLDEQW